MCVLCSGFALPLSCPLSYISSLMCVARRCLDRWRWDGVGGSGCVERGGWGVGGDVCGV